MTFSGFKSCVVAVFSAFLVVAPMAVLAQHEEPAKGEHAPAQHEEKKEGFDANKVIFSHIMDAHEYHLF